MSYESSPVQEIDAGLPVLAYDPFKRLRIVNSFICGITIRWELKPNFDDDGPYLFTVQMGRNVADDAWETVNDEPVTGVGAIVSDETRRLWGKHPNIYYRIRLETATAVYYSAPQQAIGDMERRDWLLARKIARNEYLLHKKYGGKGGLLFKRRLFGAPCPGEVDETTGKTVLCRDPATGATSRTNCLRCFGTGVLCGYYEPVECHLVITQKGSDRKREDTRGNTDDIIITGRGLAWPTIEFEDIWVQLDSDARWSVRSTRFPAEMRGVPLFQTAELRQLPLTDPAYRLPLEGTPCDGEENCGAGGYAYI